MGHRCSCIEQKNNAQMIKNTEKLYQNFNKQLPETIFSSHQAISFYAEHIQSRQHLYIDQLKFKNKSFNTYQVQHLCYILPFYSHVRKLFLTGSLPDGDSIQVICQYLPIFRQLQYIDLSDNPIGPAEAQLIGQSLQFNTNPLSINISNCQIESQGVLDIVKCIETLSELTISNCKILDKGSDVFYVQYRHFTQTQSLDISHNFIGEQGALRLSWALPQFKSLKKLDISSNQIGDQGLIHLSKQLNKKIQDLNISNNNISFKGLSKFTEHLYRFKNLQSLNLSKNDLGNQAGEMLEQQLKYYCQIQYLDLRQCQISTSKMLLRISLPTADILFN